MRTLCRVLPLVIATPLVLGSVTGTAWAGTGSANWCHDGLGDDISILTSPITVGIELDGVNAPGEPDQRLIVCYSTSAAGQPSTVTGGAIRIDIHTDTGTAYPGTSVSVLCVPDVDTGIAPTCDLPADGHAAPGDLSLTTPPSSICLVSLGSGCVAYLPGVKIVTGGDGTRDTAVLRILGTTVPVNLPSQCIAVIVTC